MLKNIAIYKKTKILPVCSRLDSFRHGANAKENDCRVLTSSQSICEFFSRQMQRQLVGARIPEHVCTDQTGTESRYPKITT